MRASSAIRSHLTIARRRLADLLQRFEIFPIAVAVVVLPRILEKPPRAFRCRGVRRGTRGATDLRFPLSIDSANSLHSTSMFLPPCCPRDQPRRPRHSCSSTIAGSSKSSCGASPSVPMMSMYELCVCFSASCPYTCPWVMSNTMPLDVPWHWSHHCSCIDTAGWPVRSRFSIRFADAAVRCRVVHAAVMERRALEFVSFARGQPRCHVAYADDRQFADFALCESLMVLWYHELRR